MVTIDPSIEACQAIVARINSAVTYTLARPATYSEQIIDEYEKIDGIAVDISTLDSETLNETLDLEDRTNHEIGIWIRSQVNDFTPATIDPLKLLVRKIFQRILYARLASGRVQVWNVDTDMKDSPEKDSMRKKGLFVARLTARVEVEASP